MLGEEGGITVNTSESFSGVELDLRVLRYFLAVATERSITGAAKILHISQPALSRKLSDFERKLGQKLFERGSRTITLTTAGQMLKERAEQILSLTERTEQELAALTKPAGTPVYIGAAETKAVRILGRVTRQVLVKYPHTKIHVYSGDSQDVLQQLETGLLDFGLIFEPIPVNRMGNLAVGLDYLRLDTADQWGMMMRRDHPLAKYSAITSEQLQQTPLLVSRQSREQNMLSGWLGQSVDKLHLVGTYNLLNNAALLVLEGVGCALCLNGIINTSGNSNLTFRPLAPRLEAHLSLVWKPSHRLSASAALCLELLRQASARG